MYVLLKARKKVIIILISLNHPLLMLYVILNSTKNFFLCTGLRKPPHTMGKNNNHFNSSSECGGSSRTGPVRQKKPQPYSEGEEEREFLSGYQKKTKLPESISSNTTNAAMRECIC